MHNKSLQAIGIFDSGIGGLTVVKAVVDALPNEEIIYFGDTKHLPYGDKSISAIQEYSKNIVDFLLNENCKLILIACNSASAAAYDYLKKYIGDRALLVNVIDPMVEYLGVNFSSKKVGLIATKLTIESKIYHKKIAALKSDIVFSSLATPLLVPAIEEGFFEHKIIDVLLQEYLSHDNLQGIDALVLGCTHYPVIRNCITNFYHNTVEIVDSSKVVAANVAAILKNNGLLNNCEIVSNKQRFLVSDYTNAFVKSAKLFFGEKISLELHKS